MSRPALDPQIAAEIVKLRAQGESWSAIARACGVGRSTARKYAKLAEAAFMHSREPGVRSDG